MDSELSKPNERSPFKKSTFIAAITALLLILSICFSATTLTGNTIADLDQTTSAGISTILYVIGLIASLFLLVKNQ
jgi:hypothetical protein